VDVIATRYNERARQRAGAVKTVPKRKREEQRFYDAATLPYA
jgi:hypothetical protein